MSNCINIRLPNINIIIKLDCDIKFFATVMERVLEKPKKKEKKRTKKNQKHAIEQNKKDYNIQDDSGSSKIESKETTLDNFMQENKNNYDGPVTNLEESSTLLENEKVINETNISDSCSVIEIEKRRELSNIQDSCTNSKCKVENELEKEVPRESELKHMNDEKSVELGKILVENKKILSSLNMKELEFDKLGIKSDFSTNKLKTSVLDTIKPYTEAQLSAFYTNTELQVIDNFTEQYIEAELKGLAVKKHPLYELLNSYLHVREKVTGNNLELDQLRKEYRDLQGQLWSIDSANISAKAECQDGNTVTACHSFARATFHRSVYQSIFRILSKIQECTYENHVLYSYSAEDLRLQIEIYLQTLVLNSLNVTQLDKNKDVTLSLQDEPLHWRPYLNELRLCISVLFAFQRKLIKDNQFIKETRAWLSRLIAILLRIANYQDHLFLLNHILRCPSGVGSWAAGFVQMPLSEDIDCPFLSFEINHILAVLTILLSPIRERDKFLEDIAQIKDGAQDALWVMVDSEGEEDEEPSGTSLRENDLVALVNQIPLDGLFRSLLLVRRRNSEDCYVDCLITEHHILRFLAFSTTLLKIINRGLQTYNQPRYNQFSKRLSRFIRHIVQYASDQWERFYKMQNMEDSAMLERLQVEYDSFFLRAVYYLYSSQKLGAWQFLAVVPYNLVSMNTLWKIFYFLHDSDVSAEELLTPSNMRDFSMNTKDNELNAQFIDKLSILSDAEIYYLLNTFANMALARSEHVFIQTATIDLLQIGFVNKATQDICSKTSKILLTHITSKYPQLLSDILKKVKENIQEIGDLSLYLYEELPLAIWKLNDKDFEVLSRLLLSKSVTQIESKLARMILSRLNWGFNEAGILFLPHELHCDVAILVLQAVDQEPGFQNWGWQTILRLKLHISDHGFEEIGRIMEIDRYDVLLKGIREKKPLHSFTALLLTTWGHLVPLICSNGLGQLLFLQSQQKHEAVLFALYLIMPLFLDSQECIINCLEFQEVLSNLLNADRGYISMAKALISSTNTVLQQFGNMIETQMVNYKSYDLESPKFLVRLWMNSLISMENWTRDYGVLYLLDVIVRAAFFHNDALMAAESELRELIQASTPQEQGGAISSLFKWVSSTNQNASLISSSLSPFPWLAYMMISIEHDEREKKTGLWKELLVQLSNQKGKVNVDSAIKKAANAVKVNSLPSSSLCIYRYAQLALDTPVDHSLVVLIWQKFFELYLQRIPISRSVDKGCVGEKFFDGLINFAFLKKMKRRLQETVQFYQAKIDELEKGNTPKQDMIFFRSYLKICIALELWLEEPRLQEANLLFQSLPPQYESQLLLLVVQGIKRPWYEYLNYNKVKQEQQDCVRIWRVSNFRENTNVNRPLSNPGASVESTDAVERILRRLTSYDAPKPAPTIEKVAPVIPVVDISSLEAMFNILKPNFNILKQFAHNHLLKVSEHKALNCSYQELIPQLYRSVLVKVNKKVPCKGKNNSVNCSGAAVIELQMEEARINERINHQIESNRQAYESLLCTSLNAPSGSLCTAAVFIQHTLRILQQQLNCNPATSELGVEFFYYFLPMLNEEITNYLPTKTLFSTCLEKLGQSHICGVEFEMPRLLERILKEPNLGEYLAPHFSPGNVGTSNLLLMYQSISHEIGQKYDVSFALLSKFDIDNWLHNKKPKLNQRSQFIEFVIKGLSMLGYEPPIEAMILHGLYRKHLLSVFEFQFPEHYGEILVNILRSSSGTSEVPPLAISVWLDLLNSIAYPAQIHLKIPLREQLRCYAQNQQKLQYQEILETVELLATHFTKERLQYGLYGLYPKCRHYLDVYALLLGMAGHVLIISSLNTHQGLESDKMCEKIWPYIRDMFTPWIAPYSMQNLKDNMASWIQQLADDRSVLLPWITADVHSAQIILNSFQECILFLLHVLPACGVILNYVWQWYVTTFAHGSVKEQILNPVHDTLMELPWQNFWPSISDLEIMLRIVDQYLPECHQFMGHIFISLQWMNWMNQFTNCPIQLKSKVNQCFINLLVKLSNEPNIRSKHVKKLNSLLVQAENLDWKVLESNVFQHVMDWYIMSCDCNVIFKSDPIDLDFRVLHFLKTVSGYNEVINANGGPDKLNKRYIYVRSYVKLMSVFASRHKLAVPTKETEIYAVINNEVKHLDMVVKSREELNVIFYEFLNILNIASIGHIGLKCISRWISTKRGNDLVIAILLQISGEAVSNYEYVASLYELALESYFQNVNELYEPSWRQIKGSLRIVVAKQIELEQVLISKGSILTLNAVLLQKASCNTDYNLLMNQCIDWLSNIKISDSVESKLPVIWIVLLDIALKYSEINESATGGLLYRFSQILLQISDDKSNSGWGRGFLTAIGISKTGTISLPFKFLCRALGGYILAQLPDMKGQPQIIRKTANASARVGQPGGNTECVKILLKLDFGQTQGKLKECAELALNQIQDSNNSLHNSENFLRLLTKQFYDKPYYREIS